MASYNTLKKMSYKDLAARFERVTGQKAEDDGRPLSRPELVQALVDVDAGVNPVINGEEIQIPYADLDTDVEEEAHEEGPVTDMTEQDMEDLRNQYFEATGEDPLSDGVYNDPEGMQRAIDAALEDAQVPEEEGADAEVDEDQDEGEDQGEAAGDPDTEQPSDKEPVITGGGRVKLTDSILVATTMVDDGFTAADIEPIINGWLKGNGEDPIEVSYVRAYLQHFVRTGTLEKSGRGKQVTYSRK